MVQEKPSNPRPIWVEVGLFGLSSRASAMAFFWLCVGLTLASLIGGFFFLPLFLGVMFGFSALWYWLAIRWVDKNDRWV